MAGRIAEQIVSEVLPPRSGQGTARPRTSPSPSCELSLSLGAAAFYPAAPCTLDELLHLADERMYAAKRARKAARAALGEVPRSGGPEEAGPGGADTHGPAAKTRMQAAGTSTLPRSCSSPAGRGISSAAPVRPPSDGSSS
jgi:hypothetical protein